MERWDEKEEHVKQEKRKYTGKGEGNNLVKKSKVRED